MSKDKKRIPKLAQKLRDEIGKIEKKHGVELMIQARTEDGVTLCLGTMKLIDALGALEYHKAILMSGLSANQSFDSMVQGIESRPDLVARFHRALSAGCNHEGKKAKK